MEPPQPEKVVFEGTAYEAVLRAALHRYRRWGSPAAVVAASARSLARAVGVEVVEPGAETTRTAAQSSAVTENSAVSRTVPSARRW